MRLAELLDGLHSAYINGVSRFNPYEEEMSIFYKNIHGKYAVMFGTSHDEHIRQMIVSNTDIVRRWAVWSDDSGIIIEY